MTTRLQGYRGRTVRRAAMAGLTTGLVVLGTAVLPTIASAEPDDGPPPGTTAIAPYEDLSDEEPEKKDPAPQDPKKDDPDNGGGDDDDGGGDNGDGSGAVDPDDRFGGLDAPVRPGALMETGDAGCTMNFAYTSGDSVFVGYAAHCAAGGGVSEINGCEVEDPGIVDETLVTIGEGDGAIQGTLAYSSWVSMQAEGETDLNLCELNDFALVEIDPADVGQVNPTVPSFGGPTDLDTDGTEPGEEVFSFQPNINPAVEILPGDMIAEKVGTSNGDERDGRTHVVMTMPPGVQGDSGSGYLDGEGKAFGALSTLFVDTTTMMPIANGVSDLAMALEYANENGDIGTVNLVRGEEEFATQGMSLLPFPTLPLGGLNTDSLTPLRP